MDAATLPVPVAQARRRLTAQFIQSDSALYAMLNTVAQRNQEKVVPGSVTNSIRTLAGERAGHVQLRMGRAGPTMDMKMSVTARDGIVYVLMTGAPSALAARYAPLFEQIRASLVLAPAPAG